MTERGPAEAIKAARLRRGLSARALAEATGEVIDRNRVANLENGRGRTIAVWELLALAKALQVPPIELLVGADPRDGAKVQLGPMTYTAKGLMTQFLVLPPGMRSGGGLEAAYLLRDLLPLVPSEKHEQLIKVLFVTSPGIEGDS